MSGETALELADRALGHLDGEGQATVTSERSLMLRYARSAPTQATEIDDTSVHLLSLRDGHVGGAVTNRLDDDSLRDVARRAADAAATAARAAGGPGDHPGLPQPAPVAPAGHHGFDEATARIDPAPGGEALRAAFVVAAEHGLEAFGTWTEGAVQTALASTAGLRAADRVTDAFMKVICRDDGGRTGWDAQAAVGAAGLDPEAGARRAAAKVGPEEPVVLEPGEYPVVLDADAVGGLLEMLAWLAFNGLAHAEGRGALEQRLGTRIGAPSIDLADDPSAARTWPRAFDLEGVPKAPLALIEGGVARHVVHDSRSAARAGGGARSTGHALAPGRSPRPGADEPCAGRRRRRRRGRAGRPDRARHLRDAAVVPQRRPPAAGPVDRDHARRDVPHRGRPHHPPAARRALHGLRPAPARRDGGAGRRCAPGHRGRVLRAALRQGRRLPAAARAGLPHHGLSRANPARGADTPREPGPLGRRSPSPASARAGSASRR
ncbi:hypothetical protein FSW04_10790 [Baekduia soli]|uniref:TldD/PmbA family protein n=1 Tax=Baekduia soli TaxID=496014 RepID=A0A5B8U587_9ACTN|nr:hypothetical protein FSW04_10790 [Baekduia soli]